MVWYPWWPRRTAAAALRPVLLAGLALVGASLLPATEAQAQTVINVTVGSDSGTSSAGTTGGPGTLSAALAQINASTPPGGFIINLQTNVTLSGPLSPILNSVTISGNGFTISGNNSQRIFMVGVDTATQTSTAVAGSIIAQRPQVTLSNLTLSSGLAVGGAGGNAAGGGLGAGGALFINQSADVSLNNVRFANNRAVGGNGGLAAGGGFGGGGGLGGNGGASGSGGGGGIFGNGGGSSGGGGGVFGHGATSSGSLGNGGGGYSGNGGQGSNVAGPGVNGQNGSLSIAGLTGSGGSGLGTGGTNGGGGSGAINFIPGPGGGGGGFGGGADIGSGGNGGFGGGGGSSGGGVTHRAGDGGFGGGGGASNGVGVAGAGGFGGGGGGGSPGTGDTGGFGGGGGGGVTGGSGGFAAGAGNGGGGGGGGLGAAVFVMAGGSLKIAGPGSVDQGATSGGAGANGAGNGSAFGSGLFLQGNGAINIQPGSGTTQTISDGIADQTGSGGTGANAGSWAMTVSGGGTLVLNGANTYSGGTTVTGATLVVNGAIGDPIINAGGVLMGTGSVGATQINAGGAFMPGSGTPGSSMTVTGSLAFASGALYVVNLNPATSSFAAVTGTASLAGTVQANFGSGNYISKQYTILTAAGGLSGTFSGISTVNLPPGMTESLSYSANSVFLNLGPGFANFTGLNQNQQNVAGALTNFFNTTGGIPAQFVGLTSDNLAQVDGEVATGAERAVFQFTSAFLDLMLDPFLDGRGGGVGGPALGFAAEREAFPDDIALAYAKAMKAPAYKAPPLVEQRWSMWASGFGGSSTTGGDAAIGSHDLTARVAGGAAGVDYHFTRDAVIGFALAGGGTNWALAQGLGGGRSDAFQGGVYAAARSGPAYVAASLAAANHWMSTDRVAAFGDHLSASFDAQSYGGRVEGGYRFALPIVGVTPYAALQAQSFHTPRPISPAAASASATMHATRPISAVSSAPVLIAPCSPRPTRC